MSRFRFAFSLVALAPLGMVLAGCSRESAPPPAAAKEGVVEEVEVPKLSSSGVTEAMAALGEADRAAALAQKVCPVSDEPLGEMGTPIKVTVKGRDVFLCCEGCRDKIEAEPDKYLTKLDAK